MTSSSRKAFIASAAAAGASALVSTNAPAQAAASDAPAAPSPSPSASPAPSAASLEVAAQMKRFDPSLTEDQVHEVARGIDDQNAYGGRLHKRRALHNGDAPAPSFTVQ